MFYLKKASFLLFLVTIFLNNAYSATVEFAGDATVVSTYVWRGVKQFDGAALQGNGEFTYGILAVGYWISSLNIPDVPVETDPYIGITLPYKSVNASIGATLYSFDFFSQGSSTVYEINTSLGIDFGSLSFHYTPEQDNVDESLYWLELSGSTSVKGADLSAQLGYGTYSNFVNEDDKAVTTAIVSAGKTISEFCVSWNWVIGLSDGMSNTFFFSIGHSF